MSIEALKTELRALPVEERRKLMAFMVVFEDEAQTTPVIYCRLLSEPAEFLLVGRI